MNAVSGKRRRALLAAMRSPAIPTPFGDFKFTLPGDRVPESADRWRFVALETRNRLAHAFQSAALASTLIDAQSIESHTDDESPSVLLFVDPVDGTALTNVVSWSSAQVVQMFVAPLPPGDTTFEEYLYQRWTPVEPKRRWFDVAGIALGFSRFMRRLRKVPLRHGYAFAACAARTLDRIGPLDTAHSPLNGALTLTAPPVAA